MAVTTTQLQGLYLAYFGRPADTDGLAFYTSHSSMTLWDVADAFSASPESQSLFGTSITDGVIDSIYMNLFNRHAEPDGLAYWTNEVNSGRLSAGAAAYGILIGAQNEDRVTVANKLDACDSFTSALVASGTDAYAGDAAAAYARTFVHGVDGTDLSGSVGVGLAGDCVAAMAHDLSGGGATQVIPDQLWHDYFEPDTGVTHVVLAQGIHFGSSGELGQVQSGTTVEIAGAGGGGAELKVDLASDTGSDALGLKLNHDYADNNDTTATGGLADIGVEMQNVEHVRIESTGSPLTGLTNKVDGWQPDGLINWLYLADDALQSLVITGDQALELVGRSMQSVVWDKLSIVDASQLSAPAFITSPLGGHVAFDFLAPVDAKLDVILGSQTSANGIEGSYGANHIVGGAQDDFIHGLGGGDTLTGGGGNDVFTPFKAASLNAPIDTITDFQANTVGNGAAGSVDGTGAPSAAARNGDILDLTQFAGHTITVSIADSQAQALQQIHDAGAFTLRAALDSSNGMLYMDTDGDGVADTQVELTGVTFISAAAFLLNHA